MYAVEVVVVGAADVEERVDDGVAFGELVVGAEHKAGGFGEAVVHREILQGDGVQGAFVQHAAVVVGLAAVVGEVGEYAGQRVVGGKLHHHAVYGHAGQQAGSGRDGFARFGDDAQFEIVLVVFGHGHGGKVVVELAGEGVEREPVLERVFLPVVANDDGGAVFEDVLEEAVVEGGKVLKIRRGFGHQQEEGLAGFEVALYRGARIVLRQLYGDFFFQIAGAEGKGQRREPGHETGSDGDMCAVHQNLKL